MLRLQSWRDRKDWRSCKLEEKVKCIYSEYKSRELSYYQLPQKSKSSRNTFFNHDNDCGVAVAVFLISEFLVNYYLKRVSARLKTGYWMVWRRLWGKFDSSTRCWKEWRWELDVIACHFNEMCEKLDLHIQKSYLAEIRSKKRRNVGSSESRLAAFPV